MELYFIFVYLKNPRVNASEGREEGGIKGLRNGASERRTCKEGPQLENTQGEKHEGNFKSCQRIPKQIEIAPYQCQTLGDEQNLICWLDYISKPRERSGCV